jgi:peptidoglycan hydrolase CwlO-like protein
MSTTIKVFIVLTLLMTLGCMYISMVLYATNENWKRRWDQDTKFLVAELRETNQNVADLSLRVTKADNQVVNLKTEIDNDQQKIKEQENKITDLEQSGQNKDLALKKAETDYNSLKDDFMAQSRSLEQVRQRNAELMHIASVARAVAFNLNVKLSEVEDDLNTATTELTQRQQNIDELTQAKRSLEAKMGLLRQHYPKIADEISDPTAADRYLTARVAAIRPDPTGHQDLVVLTIGKDEQVQEGTQFIIYRDNQYIVKVRAENIRDTMVMCRVIHDSWNTNNLQISLGDSATNRF